MRRVIFNQKGGVGKSSIAVNLAALAARRGLATLLVDLDAQANASHYLLGDARPEVTVAGFFEQFLSFRMLSDDLEQFVLNTPYENLDLVAASGDLLELQSRLEAKHKIYKLKEGLDALPGYDAVFIDTPPALNFYTLSALIAADRCLIPFDCDAFSRQAIYSLMQSVAEVQADHNPELAVEGIVVNQYQSQASLPRRVVDELRQEDLPVMDTLLPASIKMRESHEAAQPLVYLAPRHKLSLAFEELFGELEGAR